MFKLPHLEINCIPSKLNTSTPTGVASKLAQFAEEKPMFDGVTIQQMRGNPMYQRGDTIDIIGKAQKALADAAKIVKSRSSFLRKLNDTAQKLQKPSN